VGDLTLCGKDLPPGALPLERGTCKARLLPLAEQAESKSPKRSSRPGGRELFSLFPLSSQISLIFSGQFNELLP